MLRNECEEHKIVEWMQRDDKGLGVLFGLHGILGIFHTLIFQLCTFCTLTLHLAHLNFVFSTPETLFFK